MPSRPHAAVVSRRHPLAPARPRRGEREVPPGPGQGGRTVVPCVRATCSNVETGGRAGARRDRPAARGRDPAVPGGRPVAGGPAGPYRPRPGAVAGARRTPRTTRDGRFVLPVHLAEDGRRRAPGRGAPSAGSHPRALRRPADIPSTGRRARPRPGFCKQLAVERKWNAGFAASACRRTAALRTPILQDHRRWESVSLRQRAPFAGDVTVAYLQREQRKWQSMHQILQMHVAGVTVQSRSRHPVHVRRSVSCPQRHGP